MHCIDGKDYSVFSVLPPYNTLHAQVIKIGDPPVVSTGVTVSYEAVPDTTGSTNVSSSSKTNFWIYVKRLFGATVAPDVGLTGNPVQSSTPHAMKYNSASGYFEAVGIPTIPYDEAGNRNAYPMAKIVAKDSSGNILGTATAVLAVSDEMNCATCHASGSNSAAQPAGGWEYNPDSAKDVKFNILKKHDERWAISGYLTTLQANGYIYQASLYQTAKAGTPILCASCHGSNALSAPGLAGIKPLTADMHTLHATAINPSTGATLDNATTPLNSCYLCHPGQQTKCQRGAMNKTACYDCHGNLTKVGDAQRQGWLDLPTCQMCHANSSRFTSTFDSTGAWRTTTDTTFATTPDKPSAAGKAAVYAEGILKVCKSYVESPLGCVSGVSGADLKKRIARIMAKHMGQRLSLRRKLILMTAAILSVGLPLALGALQASEGRAQSASAGQTAVPEWQTRAGGKMSF